MGHDGRAGLRLLPWLRALQLPRGRGARAAAPETARGLPSVKFRLDVCRNLRSCTAGSSARAAAARPPGGGPRGVRRDRQRPRPLARPASHRPTAHLRMRCSTSAVAPAGIWRAPLAGGAETSRTAGRPARRRGQRSAGRVRLGAVTANPEGPPGEHRCGPRATWMEISRREFGTRARHAHDPGWFDNRSATLTLNDKTVQAFRVPRPGSGMRQTRARALLTRLAVSSGRCRGFREIRPATGAIPAWRWRLRPRRRPRLGGWAMLRCGQLSVLAAPDLERYEDLRDAPEQGEEPDP
jgi:hypothetical protein